MTSHKHEKDAVLNIADDNTFGAVEDQNEAVWPSYWRVFSYTDKTGWILNVIAFIAAIISGALLPLMNLMFGKAVSTFTEFGTGTISPAEFRSQSTNWTLWFIYLFI